MKKMLIIAILGLLWMFAFAQEALGEYGFNSSLGTYTEITGGTALGSTTTDDQRFVDPAVPLGGTGTTGIGFPIGFDFTFDSFVFDRVAINANGWISLGQSSLNPAVNIASSNNNTPIGTVTSITPAQLVSRISAYSRDLQAQTGASIRIQTVGTAPNRELVVQWKKYRKYSGQFEDLNFQIRLQETTNKVMIVYGLMTNNTTAVTVEVGLRGSPATTAINYYNLTSTTSWVNPAQGTTSTAVMSMSNTIFPANGTTYTWTPVASDTPPNAPVMSSPANGATQVPATTSLNWTTGGGGATGFRVSLGTDNPPTNMILDLDVGSVNSYTPNPSLEMNTTYYWKVEAYNAYGEASSAVWSFTTDGRILVGTGNQTQRFPLGSYYGYDRSAALYTDAEMGSFNARISEIAWYSSIATSVAVPTKIYLKTTTITALVNDTWANMIAGATLVYDATQTGLVAGGWNQFVLNNSFDVDDGYGLLVLVERNYGGGGTGGAAGAGIYSTSITGAHITWNQDNTPPTGNGIVSSIRPNVALTFVSYVVSDPPNPAIIVSPIDASVNNLLTASLNWSSGGGLPIGYKLYFGTDNPPTNIINGTDLGSATTYAPTLSYATEYFWKVVPYNNDGDAADCPIWSFSTMEDPTITVFPSINSFDDPVFPSTGWTNIRTAGAGNPGIWDRQTVGTYPNISAPYSGAGMIRYNCYSLTGGTKGELITPPINFPGSDYRVNFWMYRDEGYPTNADKVNVYYNTANTSTGGTLLGTINRHISLEPAVSMAGWYNYKFLLPESAAGNGRYIIFEGVSFYGNNIFIDEVVLEQIPQIPILSYDPSEIEFPFTVENGNSAYTNVMISNIGGGTLNLSDANLSIIGSDADQFGFDTSAGFPAALTSGQSVAIPVRFSPSSIGEKTATLRINFDDVDYDVALIGRAYDVSALYESFENSSFPPVGWANPGVWSRSTLLSSDGLASAFKSTYTEAGLLSTPLLTLDANSYLMFKARINSDNSYQRLQIKYSSDRESWANLGEPIIMLNNAAFATYSVDLSSLAGNNYYIGFAAYNTLVTSNMYIDEVVGPTPAPIPPGSATLVSPANQARNINLSTNLSWAGSSMGGVATAYKVYFGTINPPTTLVATVTTDTYAISSLDYSTQYFWRVVATNAYGDAPSSSVYSFTTLPNPIVTSFPWYEDFGTDASEWPVIHWTQLRGVYGTTPVAGTNWYQDIFLNSSIASDKCARINIYGTNVSGWLITPAIVIPADEYELRFNYGITKYNLVAPITPGTQADDKFMVIMSDSSDMANPTILREWNNTGSPYVFDEIPNAGGLVDIPLTGITGTKYFAFYGESTVAGGDNDFFLDDILIRPIPTDALPDPVTLLSPADASDNMPKEGFNLTWRAALTGEPATSFNLYMVQDDPADIFSGELFENITATSFNPVVEGMLTYNYGERWFWTVEAVNEGGTAIQETPYSFQIEPDPTITTFPWLEGFEGTTFPPAEWTMVDADGDNKKWFSYNFANSAHNGFQSAASASWTSADGALNPNNWLITPPIAIPATGEYMFEWYVGAQDPAYPAEHYALYVSTTGTSISDFTLLQEETLVDGDWHYRSQNLSDYAGETIHFAFRHFNCSDFFYLKIDDVQVCEVPAFPILAYNPDAWDFGTTHLMTPTASRTFTLANIGVDTITISAGDIVLNDPNGDFVLYAENLPAVLSGTDTYSFTVLFLPQSIGQKTATISIEDNLSGRNVHYISLSGECVGEPIASIIGLNATIQDENDVALSWNSIYGDLGNPGYLHWDDNIVRKSIGGGLFDVAAKFGIEEMSAYSGMALTKVMIHISEQPNSVDFLKIWSGTDSTIAPSMLLTEQALTGLVVGWNEVILNTPVVIDGSSAIYVGYHVTGVDGTYPASVDDLDAAEGRGNMLLMSGFTWGTLTNWGISGNWNIHPYFDNISVMAGHRPVHNPGTQIGDIQPSLNSTVNYTLQSRPVPNVPRSLNGFNVFRNGQQINTGLVNAKNYLDENLSPGVKQYSIQAVHNSANGGLSNTITVEIQGDITPDTPTNVTISTGTTPGTIILSWDAMPNAEWYAIYSGIDLDSIEFHSWTTNTSIEIPASSKGFFRISAGSGTTRRSFTKPEMQLMK